MIKVEDYIYDAWDGMRVYACEHEKVLHTIRHHNSRRLSFWNLGSAAFELSPNKLSSPSSSLSSSGCCITTGMLGSEMHPAEKGRNTNLSIKPFMLKQMSRHHQKQVQRKQTY